MPRGGISSVTSPIVKPCSSLALAVHAAAEDEPLGIARLHAALVALVHLGVVGEQQAGRADRADRLLEHPPVHVRRALELHRGDVLHGVVDRERLDHEHLDLGDEQVREDHHVRRAVDQDLARLLSP